MQHRAGTLALVLPMAEQERLVSRSRVVEVELAVRAVFEAREGGVGAEERHQEDIREPAIVPRARRVGIKGPAGDGPSQESNDLALDSSEDGVTVTTRRITSARADACKGDESPSIAPGQRVGAVDVGLTTNVRVTVSFAQAAPHDPLSVVFTTNVSFPCLEFGGFEPGPLG